MTDSLSDSFPPNLVVYTTRLLRLNRCHLCHLRGMHLHGSFPPRPLGPPFFLSFCCSSSFLDKVVNVVGEGSVFRKPALFIYSNSSPVIWVKPDKDDIIILAPTKYELDWEVCDSLGIDLLTSFVENHRATRTRPRVKGGNYKGSFVCLHRVEMQLSAVRGTEL